MSRRGSQSATALWWLTTVIAALAASRKQGFEFGENVCTKDITALSLQNAEEVVWDVDKVEITCVDGSVWFGERPSATCEEGRWRQNGMCRKFRWISPKKTTFDFPQTLTPGGKFAVCVVLTPSAGTMFTVKLADENNTAIVIRVVFNATVSGVHRIRQVLVHTERAGELLAKDRVASEFPFNVSKTTTIRLTPQRATTLGIFVASKKVMSYESNTPLKELQKLYISKEATVHSVNLLCPVCEMANAPESFRNVEVTWKDNVWPLEGVAKCSEGSFTWVGETPREASCVSDDWFINGECAARFIHDAVLGHVYTLPRWVTPGHEIFIEGNLLNETGFSVGLTRGKDEPVTFAFDHKNRVVTGSSNIKKIPNKDTFYPGYPLVVGRPFVMKLAFINAVQMAAQVDDKEAMFYNATIVLTGQKGVTGLVVKGDVNVSFIDLQHDLDNRNRISLQHGTKTDFTLLDDPYIDFGVKLPLKAYVCDASNAPRMPNGKVTVKPSGRRLFAHVICNDQFVWSEKRPRRGLCTRLTGWLFYGTCNPVAWTPDSITDGLQVFKIRESLSPGRTISLTAVIRSNPSHVTFQTGDKESYRITISTDREAVFVGSDLKNPVTHPSFKNIKLNSTVHVKIIVVTENTINIFINGAKKGIAVHTTRPVGSVVALETNMQVKSIHMPSDPLKSTVCTQELAPSLSNGHITWTPENKGLTGKVTCATDHECYPRDKCSPRCSEAAGWEIEALCSRLAWTSVSTADKVQPSGKDFPFPSAMTPGQEICLSGRVGKNRSHTLYFKDGPNSLFHFGLDLDNRKVSANTYVKGTWEKQVSFDTPWSVKPDGTVFMKFRILSEGQIELVINGIYNYTYTSNYRIQDVNNFATSLTILAIDLVCNRHKTNFCTKDLAPTLDNGVLALRTVGNRVEGSATCDAGLLFTQLSSTQSHCNLTAGWVLTDKCLTLSPGEVSVKPSSQGYRLPVVMTTGHEICLTANIGIGRNLDLLFKNEKKVLFRFQGVLGSEKLTASALVDGKVQNKTDYNAPWGVPHDGMVFLKLTAVDNAAVQLSVNGMYSYLYRSPFPIKDVKYLKTSLITSKIDLHCNHHQIDFCRPDLAPTLARGTVDWRVTGGRLQARSVACNRGYTLTRLSTTLSHCDFKSGWLLSVQCMKKRGYLPWENLASTYSVPLVMTPGQEICFSADIGSQKNVAFLFKDYGDIIFYFEIRVDQRTLLTSRYVNSAWKDEKRYPMQWKGATNGIVFVRFKALNDKLLEMEFNGVHKQSQASHEFRVQDIEYFKTTLTVLEFDPICNLHTVNFCREELTPSLSNGAFLGRNVDGAFDVMATCRSGFSVHALQKERSRCDASRGWSVTEECVPRTVFVWEIKQPEFGLKLSRTMDVGHKICLVVDTKNVQQDTGYRIKMTTGKSNIEYVFTYKQSMWTSQTGREFQVPQTLACPLQPLRHAEKLLITLVAVGRHKIQMTPEGNTEGCYSTSSIPVTGLQHIESDFPIRSIDMKCDQKQTDWHQCSKHTSPVIGNGRVKWTPLDHGLKGSVQCQPNFVWSGVGSATVHCDKWTGWTSDGLCIRRNWTTSGGSENLPGIPLRAMIPGRSICFTIPHEAKRPIFILSSGADEVMRLEPRFWQQIQARRGARRKAGVRVILSRKGASFLQLSMGGLKEILKVPYLEQCHALKEAAFLKPHNFQLLDVDLACDLDGRL